jgi:hypothetical protein
MTRIVNIHHKVPFDIYIGRARSGAPVNKFANPFPINDAIGHTREVVIDMHRRYLWEQILRNEITKEELLAMEDKVLGCFCNWPHQHCHGENFIKAIAWAKKENNTNC